jgi:AcrR family transcriptional regulator
VGAVGVAEEELRAADGRVPGRRGRATRQRLLECTTEMLESGSYRDLKVIDIAREAGTSPATFYQYFADVEAAILVLAEETAREAARLPDIVKAGSWRGRTGYERAEALVDGMLEFWDSHRSVLRVVDLATEEGDQRFHQIRTRLLNTLTDALAEVYITFRDEGRHPAGLSPRAVAGTLVAMLSQVAKHRFGFEFWGIKTAEAREAMARQVFWGITGQKPPGA